MTGSSAHTPLPPSSSSWEEDAAFTMPWCGADVGELTLVDHCLMSLISSTAQIDDPVVTCRTIDTDDNIGSPIPPTKTDGSLQQWGEHVPSHLVPRLRELVVMYMENFMVGV